MPAPARPATTVLLLRDGEAGLEVFLVKRAGKSNFMPTAWVFPGGRVDARDRLSGHPFVKGGMGAVLAMEGLEPDDAVSYLVAGVRETFEEAGIWLGEGGLPQHQRQPLAKGEVSLESLLETHRAVVDLDRLHPWDWWVTPEAEPRRYDTRFVMALCADEGSHDEQETVDSGWFTPQHVLDRARDGQAHLAPPTWWALTELAALPDTAAALAAVPERRRRAIQPLLVGDATSLEVRLPGHETHPEPAIEGLPTVIRFAQGRWWSDAGNTSA